MTKDEETLLMIRGMIASLPTDEQEKVLACVKDMNDLASKHGERAYVMSIALAGAILQRENP
jgi:hypothetical protein